MEDKEKKSAPEVSFYNKVCAFFEDDYDFEISDLRNYHFEITIYDKKKFDIFTKTFVIPSYATRLTVKITYADDDAKREYVSDKELAYLLKDNPLFSRYEEGDNMKFILMQPVVVQYYDDIFNNPMGYDTKTAEQLAKEIFHGCKCNFTTDID